MIVFLNKINSVVWGLPTIFLIFFTGVVLSLRTKFFQIRFLKTAIKTFFSPNKNDHGKKLSPFQAVSTALSATMGTGNIVGVAGAVALGGAGAVFWMWVAALFCMIIKFSEITLSVRFKEQSPDGTFVGGTMYYIKNALSKKFFPLATIFCVCGVIASFGIGNMVQINTISSTVSTLAKNIITLSPNNEFCIKLFVGVVCTALCIVILKNDLSIGRFCEKIMPIMTLLYVGITLTAITTNYKNVPFAFLQIVKGAFDSKSVTGGVIGSTFMAMRFGIARGVFSNEAGLGTAPIAYACSEGDEIQLGLLGIAEVFIDTIVVCTLTALTILCANDFRYGLTDSANLTFVALSSVLGNKIIFLFCPIVCFFAFSSVIGWGLYGTKFISFLFGPKAKAYFLFLFVGAIVPFSLFRSDTVWVLAEIFNGLMCLPNITAILLLRNQVVDITYLATKNTTK